MFNFFRWLFGYPVKKKEANIGNLVAAACIQRCWDTGNIVMGSIDDDGNVTIEEFPPGEDCEEGESSSK